MQHLMNIDHHFSTVLSWNYVNRHDGWVPGVFGFAVGNMYDITFICSFPLSWISIQFLQMCGECHQVLDSHDLFWMFSARLCWKCPIKNN